VGAAASAAAAAAEAVIPPALEHRSPFLTTCPFFRSLDAEFRVGPPVEFPDLANRCAAFDEPKAQSARQQELVCLTRAHTDCPRYLRGALLLHEDGGGAASSRPARTVSRAIAAALVLLALSAGASFAFVVVRGGLTLPGPAETQVAAGATATPTPEATPRPTPPPTPSPTPSPTPTPTATPTPTPSPTPTPVPPTPTPRPTSSRYALLRPCTDRQDCWIYTIRTGDNLYSIANYFGHSLETVYRLNPWTRTTPLRAGQQLILPPPTR
jgi:hypothetical protein